MRMTGRSANSRTRSSSSMPPVPGSSRSSRTSAGRCLLTRPGQIVRVGAQDRRVAGFGESVLDVAQHLRVVVHHEDACLTRSPGDAAAHGPRLSPRGFVGHRDRERKPGAVPEPGALGPNAAPVRFHQPLADGVTEAESPQAVAAADIGVLAEQVRQPVRRHTPPFVGDGDGDVHPVAATPRRESRTTRESAATRWRTGC